MRLPILAVLLSLVLAPAAQAQLSIGDASMTEDATDMTFTIERSGLPLSTSVTYTTSDGSATAGPDYAATTGTATIGTLQSSTTITVPILEDALDETDETFTVTLSNPSGGVTIADGTATGTIVDDDPPPVVSIAAGAANEGDPVTLTASLGAPSGKTVTASYTTANGTATAPGDYAAKTGTVTFVPGDTSEPVTVSTAQDTIDEPDETFSVTLSAPVDATLGTASANGTIVDDDAAPVASVADASTTEAGSLTFTVSLAGSSSSTVTVAYATADGTATAPGDYTAKSGTVTFDPGDTSETVMVQTLGDTLDEDDETLSVTLSAPAAATLGDAVAIGTIVDDDASPTASITDATSVEGADATFTVTLAFASARTIAIGYATADGTAVAPGDYTATSGTLTFAPGDTSKTITVSTVQDTADEPDETYGVALAGAGTATGTITDDDEPPPPVVPALSAADVAVIEGDTATVTIAASVAPSSPVTVAYATADGTATSADYTPTGGTATIAAGQTATTVTVATLDDAVVEGQEELVLVLSAPAGATLARDRVAIVLTDDDVPAKARPRVDLRPILPARDRRSPYRFSVRGTVAGPDGTSCRGRITVTARKGSRTRATKRIAVRPDCSFRTTLRVKAKKGRYRLTAAFGGNADLAAATSRSRRIRLG